MIRFKSHREIFNILKTSIFIFVVLLFFNVTFSDRRAFANVYGEDERISKNSRLNPEEYAKYSSVAQVECLDRSDQEPQVKIATAFHVGSYDTLATNAHAFADRRRLVKYNPEDCQVVYRDPASRNPIEIRKVKYYLSRWDDNYLFGDISNDIALIKIDQEAKTPDMIHIYSYGTYRGINQKILSVGFHGDIPEKDIVRRVRGRAFPFPQGGPFWKSPSEMSWPLKNVERLFTTDADLNQGASGSPIFGENGHIIGMYRGSISAFGEDDRSFDEHNFNIVVGFDKKFNDDVIRVRSQK